VAFLAFWAAAAGGGAMCTSPAAEKMGIQCGVCSFAGSK